MYGVDHLGVDAGIQQPPRLHHLEEVIRQRRSFHDQIVVQHAQPSPRINIISIYYTPWIGVRQSRTNRKYFPEGLQTLRPVV